MALGSTDDGIIGRGPQARGESVKITGIKTFCLRYDMPYALTYARGEYSTREALLVKLLTDDPAIFGWGESAMWGGPHAVTAAVIEREIYPLIAGQDPRRPEYLWEKVFQETYYHGRRGILIAALSGIDIALWDILGKCAGLPLWRLLGGFGRPVSTYASSGYYRRDYGLDAFAADVAKARAGGFRGYKMKIGNIRQAAHYGVVEDVPMRGSIADDLKRVATAREALGGDRNLMVDATTSLTARVAMRYAAALEPLEIRWFEEPVMAEDVAGCADLARRTRIAIAGFETETGRDAFARLIDAGAIQVVQPDIVQVGGITEARKIAAYAQMRHLPFTSKNYSTIVSSAACLQLLYALPNGEYFECDQDPLPWRNELLTAPAYRLEDGLAAPGEAPGLGISLHEGALKPWRVQA
jgi:D-galactarolactone cycloisomerase